MPVNETDIINNIRNSEGIISKRTQLAYHPWVQDVDLELKQKKEEEAEDQKRFDQGQYEGLEDETP